MNLLLLHGALGTRGQMGPLIDVLHGVRVRTMDFRGHGERAIPAEGLSMEVFASDIQDALDEASWDQAHLFGYSMGGYAAMLYAARHPDRVRSVVTLGTKYLWTEEGLQKELRMLDPDMMEQKVPLFAQALADAHGAGRWKEVVRAIARSMSDLAASPLLTQEVCARIQCPTLLCVGEKDTTAVPADTWDFARRVSGAEVHVLPETPHPFDRVDLDLLLPRVQAFWQRAR